MKHFNESYGCLKSFDDAENILPEKLGDSFSLKDHAYEILREYKMENLRLVYFKMYEK